MILDPPTRTNDDRNNSYASVKYLSQLQVAAAKNYEILHVKMTIVSEETKKQSKIISDAVKIGKKAGSGLPQAILS